jgi:hypothetical protein
MGSSGVLRHNMLVQATARVARKAGCYVRVEPPTRDAHGKKIRPDARIILSSPNTIPVLIDNTVTHPCNRSYLRTKARTQLATAKYKETIKHIKFDDLAAREGSRFMPLAMESYGGFGPDFDLFLLLMKSEATSSLQLTPLESQQFLFYAYATIAVALQTGNAYRAMHAFQGDINSC